MTLQPDLAEDFERYASRIDKCSGVLRFAWAGDPETGEIRLRLREAHFCRVRHCPVCQWRRSLMWLARFYDALPEIQQAHPKARWLFLTLTVKNCGIGELRGQLQAMNQAWRRLVVRTVLKYAGETISDSELADVLAESGHGAAAAGD